MDFEKIDVGANVTDIDLANGGYNYYNYIRSNGSALILRENTGETEYRYAVWPNKSDNTLADFWTNRTSHTYVTPAEFPHL